MFKRFLSTALAAAIALSMCVFNTYADEGYNYSAMKEAYTQKVKSEKSKKNNYLRDAYVVDIFNNRKPALIIMNNYDSSGDMFNSTIFMYENNNLKELSCKNDLPDLIDNGIQGESGIANYVGGTGGYTKHLIAVDKNNKKYAVVWWSVRNGKHHETDDIKSNIESDVVTGIRVGYYENYTFHPVYYNETYHYNNSDYSYAITSQRYDQDGNAYNEDIGTYDDEVMKALGLTNLFGYDGNNTLIFPKEKGNNLFKYYDDPIAINLNGTTLSLSKDPVIINGSTLVPMREIFEAMGAKVDWDGETQTVTGTTNGTTVNMTIGSSAITKNGVTSSLGVPAQLIDGYTMVPVRAVAESFGAKVDWDGTNKIVSITAN